MTPACVVLQPQKKMHPLAYVWTTWLAVAKFCVRMLMRRSGSESGDAEPTHDEPRRAVTRTEPSASKWCGRTVAVTACHVSLTARRAP